MKYKRPIRIVGEIAYVPLTKGYEAVIDVEDVPLVSGHNWYAAPMRNSVYAMRGTRVGGTYEAIAMHRVLMGDPEGLDIGHADGNGLDIDHADGTGLNNRRRGDNSNLREATRQQNQFNQRRAKNNTSGFKGVSPDKRRRKWQATISIEGKNRFLGRFDSPEAAAAAYREASSCAYAEFARFE